MLLSILLVHKAFESRNPHIEENPNPTSTTLVKTNNRIFHSAASPGLGNFQLTLTLICDTQGHTAPSRSQVCTQRQTPPDFRAARHARLLCQLLRLPTTVTHREFGSQGQGLIPVTAATNDHACNPISPTSPPAFVRLRSSTTTPQMSTTISSR